MLHKEAHQENNQEFLIIKCSAVNSQTSFLTDIMITVKDTHYSADGIKLTQILYSTSKVNMLKICKKLDLVISYEDSENNQWHIIMPTDVRNTIWQNWALTRIQMN